MRRYWIAIIAVICCSLAENVYAATDLEVLKAAHKGDVDAMRRIGMRMYRGCSRGNPTLGIEWLKKAVEHGDVEAMYCLGRIYQTKGNAKLAVEYLEQASEKGFEKATKALEKMPLEFSHELVEKKAKSGNYKACVRLLKAYLLGKDGVGIDLDTAWKWSEQAMKLKSKETRETIKKWDASQTVPLWEKIVDKNKDDREALMYLAELYEKGADGLSKDEEKAKKYYQEAATAGDPQAVAWLKERGLTFETKAERDARIAREREELQRKLQESQEVLYDGLHAYIFGKIESAKEKLRQAAGVGNVDAQAVLAHILENGTQQEKKERIELLKKAAEQEHPYALNWVGAYYMCGEEGFPKDERKGRELLDKAAKNGSREAASFLCIDMVRVGDLEGAIAYGDRFTQKYDAISREVNAILYLSLRINDNQVRDTFATMAKGGSAAAIRWLASTLNSLDDQLKLYTLAMNKGDAEATYRMGIVLEEIDGNDVRSARFIEKAADMGFVRAMNVWGVMLLDRKEYERAISYFKKAAEHGSPSALHNLALGDVSPKERRRLLLRAYMLFLLQMNTGSDEKLVKEEWEPMIKKSLPPL